MQNFFYRFSTFVRFLGSFLKKVMFLKNGQGRHEMGAMSNNFVLNLMKLIEEDLLKVLLKNLHLFQKKP